MSFPKLSIEGNSPFKSQLLTTGEGEFVIYRSEDAADLPVAIFVNAIGFPAAIAEPLALQSRSRLCLVTWDQRGMPGPNPAPGKRPSLEQHARDLAAIVRAIGEPEISFLGFCNGAEIVLRTIALLPRPMIARVILTNGFFRIPAKPITPSTRALLVLLEMIRKDPAKAQRYYEVLSQRSIVQSGVPDRISKYPFLHGAEEIVRLADVLLPTLEGEIRERPSPANMQITIIRCEQDTISHPDESTILSKQLAGSHLISRPDAGHFAVYENSSFQTELTTLLLGE